MITDFTGEWSVVNYNYCRGVLAYLVHDQAMFAHKAPLVADHYEPYAFCNLE